MKLLTPSHVTGWVISVCRSAMVSSDPGDVRDSPDEWKPTWGRIYWDASTAARAVKKHAEFESRHGDSLWVRAVRFGAEPALDLSDELLHELSKPTIDLKAVKAVLLMPAPDEPIIPTEQHVGTQLRAVLNADPRVCITGVVRKVTPSMSSVTFEHSKSAYCWAYPGAWTFYEVD